VSDTTATDAPRDILDTGEAGGRAIRGGALFTGAYVAGLLMSLASVPFMIRHLGVVDYGFFVSASAIIFIIGGFTEAGLTNLGVREYAHLPEHEREPFLRHLIGLRLVLTSIGVVVATGVAAILGSPGVVVAGVAISGLGLLIGLTQQTYMVPLTVQLRMGWISVLGLTRQALLSVLVVAFVLAGFGLIAFFWATVIQSVLVCALTIVLVRGTAPLLPAFDGAAWRRILHDTVAYALAAAVGLIYFRTAAVLLLHVSSEHETGIFSAAFRIVEVLVALPWMLVSAGFPILSRAARDDEARLGYALQRIFEVSTVLGVAISLGLCVGAPFAIDVVAGSGFKESIPVLRWQSLGLVTSFLMVTWTYALLSLKLYGPLLRANAAAAVVAVVAVIVLGGQYGAEGAAIATVLAEAVLAGASLAALIRHRPNLRPNFGVIPKVLVALAVAVAVALLVPAPSLVLALLAGAVYGLIVLALKAVPPEVMTALLRRA
jgi:O-antigen/teichoic acid export membrane protein